MAHGGALLTSAILRAAARDHAGAELVSRVGADTPRRTTYADAERRGRRLAGLLLRLGVAPGEPVAILGWDDARVFEVFHAVAGIGAVAHPLDPNLPPHLLAEMLTKAGDVLMFADPALAALVSIIAIPARHTLRRVIMLADEAEMPVVPLPATVGLHCTEPLLVGAGDDHAWAALDETVPAVRCEASDGNGEAEVLSHRAVVLAALAANQPDGFAVRAADRVLACAALQRHGAWGAFCVAPMAGAALLLPGPPCDAESLYRFADGERATLGIGASAVWAGLREASEAAGRPPVGLRRLICVGELAPPDLAAAFAALGVTLSEILGPAGWVDKAAAREHHGPVFAEFAAPRRDRP